VDEQQSGALLRAESRRIQQALGRPGLVAAARRELRRSRRLLVITEWHCDRALPAGGMIESSPKQASGLSPRWRSAIVPRTAPAGEGGSLPPASESDVCSPKHHLTVESKTIAS
jgi:hypothetical protein